MHNQLIYGDNLKALRALDSECVDLIYLDPPYNSKRDYNCTFGAVAQSKAFTDTWTWGDDDERHLRELQNLAPNVCALLDGLGRVLPRRGLFAYITTMAVRLVEMHRVLKDTGSIYLHVDPTASHYLKLVMDQIFGGGNFRNEIIWHYYNKFGNGGGKSFAKDYDQMLWYTKSSSYTFNPQREQRDAPVRQLKREMVDGKLVNQKGPDGKCIYQTVTDKKVASVWRMPCLQPASSEMLGYPTQKPLALLERIIQASSNEGDVVLDPYMGSGTTIEAAAKHGRKWIGIDVTHHAVATTVSRLKDCGLEVTRDQIIGVPEDLASARQLKTDSPRQFDAWCVLQCEAMPADEGDRIIGIRQFASIADRKEHKRRALYLATEGDPPTMEDVKKTMKLMERKGCEVGFLYCFEMPEDPAVLKYLQNLKPFKDDMREIPRLQLITMRELLHGCSAPNLTSEWRARRLRDLSKQMELV